MNVQAEVREIAPGRWHWMLCALIGRESMGAQIPPRVLIFDMTTYPTARAAADAAYATPVPEAMVKGVS